MKTTIEEKNGTMVVMFEGRLDTAASLQTAKDIEPLNNYAGQEIILDCSRLEYISSSGLRLFLSVLKNARVKGGHVYIKGINDTVRGIFTITGFSNIFEFK
ncbi:MAG: STAS domain-containing protein [Prevotella sp.]|nr:STAS domain-containing protein [Prevotella sp.]